jgi:hypothetical protein
LWCGGNNGSTPDWINPSSRSYCYPYFLHHEFRDF